MLLNYEMLLADRKRKLEKEYHLQMTEEIKEEAKNVCNYSSALEQISMQKGIQQGENRVAQLMSTLFSMGRVKDAERASVDEKFREKLYAEMDINDTKAGFRP